MIELNNNYRVPLSLVERVVKAIRSLLNEKKHLLLIELDAAKNTRQITASEKRHRALHPDEFFDEGDATYKLYTRGLCSKNGKLSSKTAIIIDALLRISLKDGVYLVTLKNPFSPKELISYKKNKK